MFEIPFWTRCVKRAGLYHDFFVESHAVFAPNTLLRFTVAVSPFGTNLMSSPLLAMPIRSVG